MKPWILSCGLSLLLSCHHNHKKAPTWDCLPAEVKLEEYVTRRNNRNLTVAEKLKELNTYCDEGKLFDGEKKELRFFRPYCGGAAPPADLLWKKSQELEELQKQYTVIVMECHVDAKALPQ